MPKWLSLMIQAGLPINSFNMAAQLAESYEYEETIGNSLVVQGAGRRRRRHHAVELPAAPDRGQGRLRHGRRAARWCSSPARSRPLDAFILAEVIDDAGLPAGVFNLVTGTGPEVGEAIAAHPGDRHGVVHRLDPGRQAGGRGRRAVAQAGRARAGRQVGQRAARRPRRRRLRAGRARRHRQGLPQLGPDLHRPDPHAGPDRPAGRRRAHRGRRGRDQVPARRTRSPTARCSARCRAQAQVERVTGYIQKGIDEGAKLVTGGPERPEGATSSGATSCSPPCSPTCATT